MHSGEDQARLQTWRCFLKYRLLWNTSPSRGYRVLGTLLNNELKGLTDEALSWKAHLYWQTLNTSISQSKGAHSVAGTDYCNNYNDTTLGVNFYKGSWRRRCHILNLRESETRGGNAEKQEGGKWNPSAKQKPVTRWACPVLSRGLGTPTLRKQGCLFFFFLHHMPVWPGCHREQTPQQSEWLESKPGPTT